MNHSCLHVPSMILGTAQLGMRYCIANIFGQPDPEEAFRIIGFAIDSGYTWFDTAQAYGNSEEILGKNFPDHAVNVNIITKLHPDIDPSNPQDVRRAIENSCKVLGVSQLTGLLLHRVEWVRFWDKGLGAALLAARDAGLIRHIGVSIYNPEDLCMIRDIVDIQLIQMPFNAWDSRFLDTGILQDSSKLVMVRSVYLQGLMTLPPLEVKKRVPDAFECALAWNHLCETWGLTSVQAAVRYVKAYSVPMVIGSETSEQLNQNILLMNEPPLSEAQMRQIQSTIHPFGKKNFVNPVNWT